MPLGRPKKYTPEFISNEAEALEKWAKARYDSKQTFFLMDFAYQRGYHSQRLSEFAKESEIFSESLKRAGDLQTLSIVKNALNGLIEKTMAIFTLKNVAGWRDRREIETKDGDINQKTDILKQIIERDTPKLNIQAEEFRDRKTGTGQTDAKAEKDI